MKKSKRFITFVITSVELDSSELKSLVSFNPTRYFNKGDIVYETKSLKKLYSVSGLEIVIEELELNNFNIVLNTLLIILQENATQIRMLTSTGALAEIAFGAHLYSESNLGLHLTDKEVALFSEIGAHIDFDIYYNY
jgi:hypothetical protein